MRTLFAGQKSLKVYFLLILMLLLLALIPESMQAWLYYERSELAQGQFWRAISGHLLHSNNWHLLMNIAGLIMVILLHGNYYRWRQLLLSWLLFALIISTLLYLLSPQIQIYVGLSGLLHAMLTLGAIKDIQLKQHTGVLLLLGLIGKVIWEQWQGPDVALAELINASVAIDAHLYGVLAGLIVSLGAAFVKTSGKQ